MSRCFLLLGWLLLLVITASHVQASTAATASAGRPLRTTSRSRFEKGAAPRTINKGLLLRPSEEATVSFSLSSPSSPLFSIRGGATTITAATNNVDAFLNAMDLLGTAVFAFSGALTAGKKGMDLLGMLLLATITSVGGGTIRDLLLNEGTVFWMKDPIYLQICAFTTVATYLVWPTLEDKLGWKGSERPVCTADAVGLAAFAVLGTQKAASSSMTGGQAFHPSMWVVSGLMSACFGGIIRDLLCLQPPRIMYPERSLYAPAPLAGSAIYTILSQYATSIMEPETIATISFLTVFCIRISAFNNPMRLPHWFKSEKVSF